MSEKYIRVEDFKNEIAELGDLRTLSTKTIGETLARCPTYTPAELMAGMWVPVTERLPEDSASVIVSDVYGEISLGYRHTPIIGGVRYPECWETADELDGIITHWMPLPQPPKEGTP